VVGWRTAVERSDMLTDPTELWLGARIDHTRMDSRSKTAIAPQRRQSISVMANFALAARTFPISPLNPAAPKPPDKPHLHWSRRQSMFHSVFAGFDPKLRFYAARQRRNRFFSGKLWNGRNWTGVETKLKRRKFPVNGTNVLRKSWTRLGGLL
jgi:hypothetical protein